MNFIKRNWLNKLVSIHLPSIILLSICIYLFIKYLDDIAKNDTLILIVIALLVIIYLIPKFQLRGKKAESEKTEVGTENELRRTIIQLIGGTLIIGGLVLSFYQLQQNQEQFTKELTQKRESDSMNFHILKEQLNQKSIADNNNYNILLKQLNLSNNEFLQRKESDYNNFLLNQYTTGLQLLKDTNSTIKLGGIFALEKIMNIDEDYHDKVVDMFCAYIRDYREKVKSLGTIKREIDSTLLPDYIRTIFKVLGRRQKKELEKVRIDLRYTNWEGMNLSNQDFIAYDFKYSNFNNSNLSKSNLTSANLSNTTIIDANLSYTNLTEAYLLEAYISNSEIRYANLSKTNFKGANIAHSNLSYSELSKSDLSFSDLYMVDFSYAKLINTNFYCSDLLHVRMHDSILDSSNFIGIGLYDPNLNKEDINSFIFQLRMAKSLKGIKLDDDILNRIKEKAPQLIERINGK